MKKTILSIVLALISICSSAQDKGYEKSIEITSGIIISEDIYWDFPEGVSLGVGMVNGYRFNQHFALGIGVGVK